MNKLILFRRMRRLRGGQIHTPAIDLAGGRAAIVKDITPDVILKSSYVVDFLGFKRGFSEEDPIGLLLCSEGNTEHIELLVTRYLTILPEKQWFIDKMNLAGQEGDRITPARLICPLWRYHLNGACLFLKSIDSEII